MTADPNYIRITRHALDRAVERQIGPEGLYGNPLRDWMKAEALRARNIGKAVKITRQRHQIMPGVMYELDGVHWLIVGDHDVVSVMPAPGTKGYRRMRGKPPKRKPKRQRPKTEKARAKRARYKKRRRGT